MSLNAIRVQCLRWVSRVKKDLRFGIAWKEGKKGRSKRDDWRVVFKCILNNVGPSRIGGNSALGSGDGVYKGEHMIGTAVSLAKLGQSKLSHEMWLQIKREGWWWGGKRRIVKEYRRILKHESSGVNREKNCVCWEQREKEWLKITEQHKRERQGLKNNTDRLRGQFKKQGALKIITYYKFLFLERGKKYKIYSIQTLGVTSFRHSCFYSILLSGMKGPLNQPPPLAPCTSK